jgi:hypothetical protein
MEKRYKFKVSGIIEVLAESKAEAIREVEELVDIDLFEESNVIAEFISAECALCDGTGEVATDEDDGEGHIMRGVGTETCLCQK